MKILLHVCCGPCSIYPLRKLREEGHLVKGYFYNPNIHPFREFKKRLAALDKFARHENFTLFFDRQYGLKEYLRQVVYKEENRCSMCYDMRLEQAAKKALEEGVDAYTTTLLYSKYQKHKLIREKGESFAEKYGIGFYYDDFREGWQEGIDCSKTMDLYRQPYCGCIYSEQERYDKELRKILS